MSKNTASTLQRIFGPLDDPDGARDAALLADPGSGEPASAAPPSLQETHAARKQRLMDEYADLMGRLRRGEPVDRTRLEQVTYVLRTEYQVPVDFLPTTPVPPPARETATQRKERLLQEYYQFEEQLRRGLPIDETRYEQVKHVLRNEYQVPLTMLPATAPTAPQGPSTTPAADPETQSAAPQITRYNNESLRGLMSKNLKATGATQAAQTAPQGSSTAPAAGAQGASADNFNRYLRLIVNTEAGYSNHPNDRGGPTMRGVTQKTYDEYNTRHGKEKKDVRNITMEEVTKIYKEGYWDKVRGSELPEDIAYVTFDGAINHGPDTAKWMLREALGLPRGGGIDTAVIQRARQANDNQVAHRICDIRLAYYDDRVRSDPKQGDFIKGWRNRIAAIRRYIDQTPSTTAAAAPATKQPAGPLTPPSQRGSVPPGAPQPAPAGTSPAQPSAQNDRAAAEQRWYQRKKELLEEYQGYITIIDNGGIDTIKRERFREVYYALRDKYKESNLPVPKTPGALEQLLKAPATKPASGASVPAGTGTAQQAGGIELPLPGYRITSKFGPRTPPIDRRTGKKGSSNHPGIDISAPEGTPLLAIHAGKVHLNDWIRGYGNTIEIDAGKDRQGKTRIYAYHHMQFKPKLVNGQEVHKNMQIGRVGNTGIGTAPHLDYTIRIDGKYVDPLKYRWED